MDGFDLLPDSIILLIFNSVADVKTLIRCRSVSKRFNSLVPQTDSLLLRVDCVISPESDHQPLLFAFLKSLLNSIHDLFNSDLNSSTNLTLTQNSPAQILSQFHQIRHLQIELPAGDLKLDKGIAIKWRADFGKTLRSCVIFAFRTVDGISEESSADLGFAGGLKARVVWTISALIAASARHYLLKDVVKQHEEMEILVLKDKEEEGTVVMEKEGLRECRKEMEARGGEWEWEASRTVVPSVRIRMRHEARVQMKNGKWVEGATLVIVRSCLGKDGVDSTAEDSELAMKAFGGGVYKEAVQLLLNSKSYLLEMNSF
ncbi:F-box protein AUF2-like [Euphorbia lathyris]|uniref:F-box protein AUF2-like n=1 Tax=Euphorbia lathyris TaxID=212925 RepID=UPI0033139F6B